MNLTGPEAFIPDKLDDLERPVVIDATLFSAITKRSTSEVSVSAALWDIYAGDDQVPPRWRGIGHQNMLGLIEALVDPDDPSGPGPITFAEFWEILQQRHPEVANAVLSHMQDDRLFTMADDDRGADDTAAQLFALTPNQRQQHRVSGLGPAATPLPLRQHTLYPKGDVDLFELVVDQSGRFLIETFDLNDGTDTFMELLEANTITPVLDINGNPLVNDNHIPMKITLAAGTAQGRETVTRTFIDYNGDCGRKLFAFRGAGQRFFSNCPPNAANPTDNPLLRFKDYLSSGISVDLAKGRYVARVSRSVDAPPSAGKYGGYSFRVSGAPLTGA